MKHLRIHGIHGREVRHISQENLDLHTVVDTGARGLQYRGQVF